MKINTNDINEDLFLCIKKVINTTRNKLNKINKKINRKNDLKLNKQISKFCDDIFIVRKNSLLHNNELVNYFSLDDDINLNDNDFEFVKSKRLDLKPMSPIEAVLQMNLTGHSFFLFLNSNTNEKAVVYKRNDGKYGMIE